MSFAKRMGAIVGSALLVFCGVVSAGAAQGTQAGDSSMQNGQPTSNSQPMQNGGQAGSGAMNIRQGIQNSLQQAGYTDVTVTPSSFLIHAKNKQGRPVAMVLGPDTFTEVTEVPTASGSSQGGSTTGSGGNTSSPKSGSGTAP